MVCLTVALALDARGHALTNGGGANRRVRGHGGGAKKMEKNLTFAPGVGGGAGGSGGVIKSLPSSSFSSGTMTQPMGTFLPSKLTSGGGGGSSAGAFASHKLPSLGSKGKSRTTQSL
jgi:hypothetical protein